MRKPLIVKVLLPVVAILIGGSFLFSHFSSAVETSLISFGINKTSFTANGNDQFILTLTSSAPNQQVYIRKWKNGIELGESPVGATDASGSWSVSGTFDASLVGSWLEEARVGCCSISSKISFSVFAASATPLPTSCSAASCGACTTQPVCAQTVGCSWLNNSCSFGTGTFGINKTTFIADSSDQFKLTISSNLPNQPVYIRAMKDTIDHGETAWGNTDANGNWQLTGTFDTSLVGSWQETARIGSVNIGYVNFRVNAPIVTPTPTVSTTPAPALLTLSINKTSFIANNQDQFMLTVRSNSPIWPVFIRRWKGGVDLGASQIGFTDSSGNFSLSGTFDSSLVGSWQEQAQVGNLFSDKISFTVTAAASTPTPAGSIVPSPAAYPITMSINKTTFIANGSDIFSLFISSGLPDKQIFIRKWKGGIDLGESIVGSTDTNGNWSITGTFDSSLVGSWQEQARIDTVLTPKINFNVTAPSSLPPAPPTSPFINFTVNKSVFIADGTDTFILRITSNLPNQPVSIAAFFNAFPQGERVFGSTDASGNWSLSGKFLDLKLVGSWQEQAHIGTLVSNGVAFTVNAPSTQSGSGTTLPPPPPIACTNQTGFASNCASGGATVMSIPEVTISNDTISFPVKVSVPATQMNAIWGKGYYWSPTKNQWVEFQLAGTPYGGSAVGWFKDVASANLSVAKGDLGTGTNYVVTWQYVWDGSRWVGPPCSNTSGCWRVDTFAPPPAPPSI